MKFQDSWKAKQTTFLEKMSFPMILRLEMITSVVSYEKKNIFHERNLKLTKNTIFNDVFCNRIFPYCRFLPIFQK